MLGSVFVGMITLYGIMKLIRFYVKTVAWGSIDRNNEITVMGKVVVITGANTGIGKTTAQEMAERGARVVMASRNETATRAAILDIQKETANGELIFMKLDLSSLESVRKFANEFNQKFNKLDILICNAGVLIPADKRAKTTDGFEMHFGVNHLGHFLLTNLLLEPIKRAAPSRIIIVSSFVHEKGTIDFNDLMRDTKVYPPSVVNYPLYNDSKLANALFNKELGKRLKGTGIQTYAVCPGIVFTEIARTVDIPIWLRFLGPIIKQFQKTPSEGCQTTLFCSLSKHPDVVSKTGEFYQRCKLWDAKDRILLKDEDAARLWSVSEKLVGLVN